MTFVIGDRIEHSATGDRATVVEVFKDSDFMFIVQGVGGPRVAIDAQLWQLIDAVTQLAKIAEGS